MKQIINLLLITIISSTLLSATPLFIDETGFNFKGKELWLKPNPTSGNAQVTFTIKKAGKGTVIILDESGTTVLKQQVQLVAGKNKITLNNITRLNEGNYTICLNTNYATYSTPLVLWK